MDNRTPKNMQELLRFAIKHQENESEECVHIDKDKKVFLDHVLQSMSVNVIEEFLKAIRILQDDGSSAEEKAEALDLIRDYIDNIDFANSFVKIDGADILINCVRSANKSVSLNAINIIAEMSQNNPFCQQYFLKYDTIELLLKYLSTEDADLVASALYALSSVIRNYEPALMEFMKKDGPKYINNCLNLESPRVFSKACFLLTSISSEFSLVKGEFAKLEVFNKLIKRLRINNGYDLEVEMILKAMSALLESRYCNPNEKDKKYIVDVLNKIIIKNGNLPECEEIVFYSKSIIRELENRDVVNNEKC